MSFEEDALRAAATEFRAGRLLMIDVLARAEAVFRAPAAVPARAGVVVATLPGDVHDIGRTLLVAMLGSAGYRVVDLGTQVPIERVVAAAAGPDVGAVALSALLLSDSTRIGACIAALDQRGLRLPVLLGGAAITRAAAERAAILPDGRTYPSVHYCRDVIEGLATLDALLAPSPPPAAPPSTADQAVATPPGKDADDLVEPSLPLTSTTPRAPRPSGGPSQSAQAEQATTGPSGQAPDARVDPARLPDPVAQGGRAEAAGEGVASTSVRGASVVEPAGQTASPSRPGERDAGIGRPLPGGERERAAEPRARTVQAVPPGGVRGALAPGPAVTPPFWGARRIPTRLADVWPLLDRHTLFRFHWGGYRLPPEAYARLVAEVFEPELSRLQADAEANAWLVPGVVTGYFPTNAADNQLIVADPIDPVRELVRLAFPRQPAGERLCLADYFRPLASGRRDVLALQAVTVGPGAAREVQRALRAGAYRRMWFVNGLAGATAEALAAFAHQQTRAALGLGAAQGLRFSWGYAACPDLAEQRKVLPLLDTTAAIGLRLSDSNTLDPEHSTAALIVQHPAAKYFGLHPGP